jgi:Ni/Fe-hydrogenase subunit HybB-like protein
MQSPAQARTFRNIALCIPFFHVLFCTMVAWDFEMTLWPGWASALFAMYHFVSSFGMMLSVLVLALMLLERTQSLKDPPGEYIFNYLAQLMLAFTILWIYTFFAQYLIIWYANLPDETGRLFLLQNGPFSHLFWLFFILKFVLPFPILIVPFSRHSRAVIAVVAVSIISGYWLERYTWIAGSIADSPAPMFSPFAIASSVIIFTTAFFLVRGAMKKFGLMKSIRIPSVALRSQID